VNRAGLLFGIAFGFLIAAAGFGDADFIHRMLLLQNGYPYLVFGSAVLTAMPLLWLLQRARWVTPLGGSLKLVQASAGRRQVYGGLLFGVGWAFSCTCPVPALAMVFSGGLLGIPVVAGLFSGILLGDRRAHTRPRAANITAAARPAS
jgi:uncharacterized membrane protein YedE/YeeE